MSSFARRRGGTDYYRILQVPHTASLAEIKASYRKLALRLHPDVHRNNPSPQQQHAAATEFQRVTEAYQILSDIHKKQEYDQTIGNNSSSSGFARGGWRKSPPPPNYRKVYAPRPPPDWKTTWDHKVHYDMHYGTGLRDEAIKQAKKKALQEGLLDYQSPLGPGFSFSDDKKTNPYSKFTPQGPPTMVFDYEEAYQEADTGKQRLRKREQVVEDLHGRRNTRKQQQQRRPKTYNAAFQKSKDCVIL